MGDLCHRRGAWLLGACGVCLGGDVMLHVILQQQQITGDVFAVSVFAVTFLMSRRADHLLDSTFRRTMKDLTSRSPQRHGLLFARCPHGTQN